MHVMYLIIMVCCLLIIVALFSVYQVLIAQALVFVVLLAKLTRKIFFGSLRTAEIEHLVERSW